MPSSEASEDVILSRRIADHFLKRLMRAPVVETGRGVRPTAAYLAAWDDFSDAWWAYQEEKEAARLGL